MSRRLMITRALVLVASVLLASACRGTPDQAKPSAWESLAARIGDGGEVSQEVALDAFASLVGPIPGGEATPGEPGVRSGTVAVRWVMRHWDELSEAQRSAVHAALDPPATITPPAAPGAQAGFAVTPVQEDVSSELQRELQQFTDRVTIEFRKMAPAFQPLEPIVVWVQQPQDPKTAAETMPLRDGDLAVAGSVDVCGIAYSAAAVKLLETSHDAGTAAERAAADTELKNIAAHELMHCHQMQAAQTAERYYGTPSWIAEGSAAWGGFLYAYPSAPAPSRPETWQTFFATPSTDLLVRTYDAVGFWSYLADPWRFIRDATAMPWEAALSPKAISEQVLATVRSEQPLARWAMSYVRRPALGFEWQTVGPGLGDQQPPPAGTMTLRAGGQQAPDVARRGFRYLDVQFGSDVEVVKADPNADGALHWGDADEGPDDTFVGTGNETLWFCLEPGGCGCPEGMERKAWVVVADRPFDSAVLSFFGIHDQGPNEELQPEVQLSAYSMDAVLDDLCQPTPSGGNDDDVDVEFTVCQTWFSADELVALVTGATRLASDFAGPVVEDPSGATIIPCFWDLERNPMPDEPWFEWLVGLQGHLVVRGDESDEQWSQRVSVLEDAVGCVPASLPRGLPACIADHTTSVDVVVPIGPDRLLWLRTDTSTTGGAPDYATDQLHAMTLQVAVAFADRLSG